MGRKIIVLLLLALSILGCELIRIEPISGTEPPKTEIDAPPTEVSAVPGPQTEPTQEPTAVPTPEPASQSAPAESSPSPTPVATPAEPAEEQLPTGLYYALVLPLLWFGLPWVIIEIFVIRYVQPRGLDVAEVRIKAQDGLFIEATISMTARRTLTLTSTRTTWPRVRTFVEKTLEQELIHAATTFLTLEDLERNIKLISDSFSELPIVRTLSSDFGLEVLWFNIEIAYPQETMDALNRKAEASAGGTAFLAYAAAAHLNPNTPEARELYKVFQVTSGQVDAARNLGGGITGLAGFLTRGKQNPPNSDDENASNT